MKRIQMNLNTKRDVARVLARRYSTMTFEELDQLEDMIIASRYRKGEMIIDEGEICTGPLWVDSGLVRVFYFKNGKEITSHFATEQHIVMSIESMFYEQPSVVQIEALENTIIYELPKDRLEETAMRSVNIQMLYRKILEEALIESQKYADLICFESAAEKYKRLMKLQPELFLRVPLTYIASYLQMTPETLSRVRSSVIID
ncbi:MAG: Crp/Fnr family transcriptional regulator [Bacteroidaceae bacterium]|nr:Crp/Fnr family transcriptional regulator [Bacteroidaceae bacterium]